MESGGSLFTLKAGYGEFHWLSDPERKQRGKITTFSSRARSNMIRFLCRIDYEVEGLPWFMTLTWPGLFSGDWREWKRCKRAIEKRLRRKLGKAFKGVCRLEPQERGAPHLSYMVWGCKFLDTKEGKAWLSRAWYEVVGSGDLKHLKAGTQVQRVESMDRLQKYVCKYQSKKTKGDKNEFFDYPVGRYWWHFGNIQMVENDVRTLSPETFYQLRRVIKGLYKAKWRARGKKARRGLYKEKRGGCWCIMKPQTICRIREVYLE
jgi:hypothetical protein